MKIKHILYTTYIGMVSAALQTIAAYLPCFGQALDKLQGKVVTHLEKLNGGEL